MAQAKKFIHYILGAFSLFTLNSNKIEVDTTSTVEQAWNNVGVYIRNAMTNHESEIK